MWLGFTIVAFDPYVQAKLVREFLCSDFLAEARWADGENIILVHVLHLVYPIKELMSIIWFCLN